MYQRLTPRPIGFVLALFHHRRLSSFGFTDCWAVSSRPTPHAPRSLGFAVAATRRARYRTPPPGKGSTCYEMLRFSGFFENSGNLVSTQVLSSQDCRLFGPGHALAAF